MTTATILIRPVAVRAGNGPASYLRNPIVLGVIMMGVFWQSSKMFNKGGGRGGRGAEDEFEMFRQLEKMSKGSGGHEKMSELLGGMGGMGGGAGRGGRGFDGGRGSSRIEEIGSR